MPKAAVDLPLPLPVWTTIRPFWSVLVAMILSRAAFFLAIFEGVAFQGVCSSLEFLGVSSVICVEFNQTLAKVQIDTVNAGAGLPSRNSSSTSSGCMKVKRSRMARLTTCLPAQHPGRYLLLEPPSLVTASPSRRSAVGPVGADRLLSACRRHRSRCSPKSVLTPSQPEKTCAAVGLNETRPLPQMKRARIIDAFRIVNRGRPIDSPHAHISPIFSKSERGQRSAWFSVSSIRVCRTSVEQGMP